MNDRSVLFNDNWKFKLFPVDTGYETASNADFTENVEVPHDWLIYDTENLYKSGEGWYKKVFTLPKLENKKCFVEFEGVYMDSTVYVNGKEAGTWHGGYTAFSYDITSLVNTGENVIMVQVRYIAPNSRWYSGAGIFRNVHLTITPEVHIVHNGVYISANGENGEITVMTTAEGEYDNVRHTIFNSDGEKCAEFIGEKFRFEEYKLWDIEEPNVYTLKTELVSDGKTVDCIENKFGFRTIRFDPNEGFFLNGRYMKIKGVCLHHDLGALGAAVNYSALLRQVMLMKKMGANAIRTAHNMPSREFLDICDKVGMLVDSECFDMWELKKTEYDNARFFKETAYDDVKSWVCGDRNHPCVIMWSIGNEIYDTHASERGYEVALMLKRYAEEFDPLGNAKVTIASNFIEWDNAQKVGEMIGISGYNYTERCYDAHHSRYPDTVIYGSETSSAVRSRGIYHFPANLSLLTHDDHQCSSLDNCCVNWGRPAEDAWIQDRDRKFCLGQFIWTGIDYIGEPTPYNTKNSYFGAVDTAGIPKDVYYFYQSVWTDVNKTPMIHLLPYWDFNEGQLIDVIAYTNAPKAELFLNGRSLGVREIDHISGKTVHAEWKVPFEKGELSIKAIDENGNVVAKDVQRSFGDPVSVAFSFDKTEIAADGKDVCFAEIYVEDSNGVPVANARNRIKVEVSGTGRLLGMDNGDSTDYEQYKTDNRKLFSGRLVAIIASDGTEGDINVKITSIGLRSAEFKVKSVSCVHVSGASECVKQVAFTDVKNDIPVRKIEVCTDKQLAFDENCKSAELEYKILPKNATYDDVVCKTVKSNGVETDIVFAERLHDGKIKVEANGDGDGYIRIYAYNGSQYPQVISDTAFAVTGLGDYVRDPYKFISAGSYSSSNIPVSVVKDGALGGFTKPSAVTFTNVDFGSAGTHMLRLYIGNSQNRDIPIRIYDGAPEGKNLIITAMFPHNNGWDGFEPYDFELPCTLKGMKDISFEICDGIIFGGFEFIENIKAYALLFAADNDKLYGDDFTVNGKCVENIGNNVVLEYTDMDFGSGTTKLVIKGRTPNDVNTIQLRYTENGENKTQLLEFAKSTEYIERIFEIEKICGKTDVSFMFMPGSKFDFESFKFIGE